MSATARANWFWSDWLGDQAVRRLTPAERGVWIDCLALMAAASPFGYLCDDRGRPLTHEEVARVVNATPVEVANFLAAILDKGVASRDRTGRIYNRRMVREASISAKRRLNGKAGGAATRLKWQALSVLPQQNAWQLPQQRAGPLFLKESKKELSSLPAASLATAPPTGALRSPPSSEQAEGKQEAVRKAPHEWTLAEIAEANARRAKTA